MSIQSQLIYNYLTAFQVRPPADRVIRNKELSAQGHKITRMSKICTNSFKITVNIALLKHTHTHTHTNSNSNYNAHSNRPNPKCLTLWP